MAGKEIRISNQIAKVQTAKKCISLMDKLKVADPRHYAQLHAKGETSENGFKQNSLIQVIIQDYSNGTGANNVKVSFNLAPEQIQFFLSRVQVGFLEFEWQADKIFGEPDANGLCMAQQFRIKRSVYNDRGQENRSPWNVYVSNGRGVKVQNANGGSYMKGGSYKREASAFIQLTDMDFFMLMTRADAYIRAFERYAADKVLEKGLEMFAESARNSGRGGYGGNQYGQQNGYGGYGGYGGQYGQQDRYGQGGFVAQAPAATPTPVQGGFEAPPTPAGYDRLPTADEIMNGTFGGQAQAPASTPSQVQAPASTPGYGGTYGQGYGQAAYGSQYGRNG